MGPCIVIMFQYIFNKMQRYTVYFIWKLLYMFRVLPPPIIRSAKNCIYSIWYLSHRYCVDVLPEDCAIVPKHVMRVSERICTATVMFHMFH
jgi:hypothetical protein